MVKYDKYYFYAGYKLLNVKNINLKVSSNVEAIFSAFTIILKYINQKYVSV